jgi:hypothetical protein
MISGILLCALRELCVSIAVSRLKRTVIRVDLRYPRKILDAVCLVLAAP